MRNRTLVTTFVLLGLTDDPQWQIVIFLFLFIAYVLSITGNLTIILLTLLDSHLKTPMYFFLQKFSFLEISLTSTCIPRFLVSIVTMNKTISVEACFTQLFAAFIFGIAQFFLLAVMSYDRYVAICKPLHYTTIMNNRVCMLLFGSCCLIALFLVCPGVIVSLSLEFCDSIIEHFFCDYSPILKLSCNDTRSMQLLNYIFAIITLLTTLALVMVSYGRILSTILKFPSAQQKKKAFSTCSSHMIVVFISYGSCIFMYIKPSAEERISLNKGVAILTLALAPVLNPFIYSLRNKQVKEALKDVIKKCTKDTSK
ncbi:olfactory receptor Olr1051 isoform X1 [Rattus norvegicus]|uniref:Olfactory receptor family 6 subfamily C member 214 n=1 Tax=Rattus norvegicus TaxID=10116 RepID=D4A2J8_RAT|nr:olfactory receptor Olr1051 [Rattus norvegicus]|eukprot:NP_001001364.1 olfactory receptor Olr1051 [Rattus norvegicus]